ncbi:alpha-L-rhamnosidase C-terminal domain-containing protein [Streptomyces sp. NPDC001107]
MHAADASGGSVRDCPVATERRRDRTVRRTGSAVTVREVDAPWRPTPVQVDWATGQLPTPYGPLRVGWENTGRAFRLTVQVPGRTRGSVTFPGDARRQGSAPTGRHRGTGVGRRSVACR